MDHDAKKAMAQKFIKKIELGVDSIKIHWNLDKAHYERELHLKRRLSIRSINITLGRIFRGF